MFRAGLCVLSSEGAYMSSFFSTVNKDCTNTVWNSLQEWKTLSRIFFLICLLEAERKRITEPADLLYEYRGVYHNCLLVYKALLRKGH